MSLRYKLVLSTIIFSALAFLAGCGSGASSIPNPQPPPGGGFSNSNLKGTYVFSVVGSDSLGNYLAMTGTLAADGNGNLTGGTFDFNNPNGAGLIQAVAIGSGSTYSVSADGRGSATFQTSAGQLGFAFVLNSSTSGQIIEFDSAGSGSGTLDLQGTVAQADIAGSYAFSFSGTAGTGFTLCGFTSSTGAPFVIPLSNVGAFTLDASGNITGGVEDFNNNCSSTGSTALTITGGTVSLATVPGTATITSSAGTFNFDVYPVTASALRFIETDPVSVMAGGAYTQSSTLASGANVVTVAGFDTTNGVPFAAAGIVDTDGNGTVTAGLEDINDGGTASSVTNFTGSYTAFTGGRSVLTLSTFVNGGAACTACQFAIYPSSGGLQIMEIDNGGTTNGVAYTQTATAFATPPQGYGMNLTGVNTTSEEDDIAEFTNTNGSFSGIIDFNDQGNTNPGLAFTSTYTADATADGRGTVAPGKNSFNLVTYVVDNATVVFVETDTNQLGLGSFMLQNSGAKSNSAAAHLAVLGGNVKTHPGLMRHIAH